MGSTFIAPARGDVTREQGCTSRQQDSGDLAVSADAERDVRTAFMVNAGT